jgi:uncharacterized protein (TIGR02246 family)
MEAALQETLDIEAIKKLKARYFRFIDTKDWAGFAQVFAEDARMLVPEADVDITGRGAIAESISTLLDGVQTVHHGHMPEIEIESDERATGVWAMFDYVEWPPTGGKRVGIVGYGHYFERYVREDGEWRIAETRLERLRRDSLT